MMAQINHDEFDDELLSAYVDGELTVRALGIPKLFDDEQDSNERSITFADFLEASSVPAGWPG